MTSQMNEDCDLRCSRSPIGVMPRDSAGHRKNAPECSQLAVLAAGWVEALLTALVTLALKF